MPDFNAMIDRMDHQHEKDEAPKDCMICRAEAWIDDLKARGTPWSEIRNMHLIASHTALEREAQRKKSSAYAMIIMALVKRFGGEVSILPDELEILKGRLIQENDGEGIKFTITDPAAGRSSN